MLGKRTHSGSEKESQEDYDEGERSLPGSEGSANYQSKLHLLIIYCSLAKNSDRGT
jgi:hypothetical protein